jgi:hypothetical protein
MKTLDWTQRSEVRRRGRGGSREKAGGGERGEERRAGTGPGDEGHSLRPDREGRLSLKPTKGGSGRRAGWGRGLLGSVFFYQRGEQRGDAATARSPITGRHRKAEFTVTASGGKMKGGQRGSTGIQNSTNFARLSTRAGVVCAARGALCVWRFQIQTAPPPVLSFLSFPSLRLSVGGMMGDRDVAVRTFRAALVRTGIEWMCGAW